MLRHIAVVLAIACMGGTVQAQTVRQAPSDQFEYRPGLQGFRPTTQFGIASVYRYGPRTANGEKYHAGGMTAAHRSLRFGTMVRVTNRRTGLSVVVRINDRGPFIKGRIIDLTPAAARAIGFSGLAPVVLNVVN